MWLSNQRALAVIVVVALVATVRPELTGPLGWGPVVLHEGMHGLCALATGASEVSFDLQERGGARFVANGGWPTLVWGAGYLAPGVAALSVRAASQRGAGLGLVLLAAMLAASLTAFSPMTPSSIAVLCLAAALGGVALAADDTRAVAAERAASQYLWLVGIADVVFDALHQSPAGQSDAQLLAVAWGVPSLAFTAIWLTVLVALAHRTETAA